MYKSFYNLREKPFQISTDPKFLWLGEKHKEALATLKYGVLDNKGFLLITGDVGTGKTTLINALVRSFGSEVICATIPDPGLEDLDFFKFIAHVFGFEKEFGNKGDFLIHFGRFLTRAYEQGKTVVLIIDEAQLLTQEMLEQIRLLSNIEKQQRKLINIFFVGQSEFNAVLLKHENRALRQRITINYTIDPLSLGETGEYIRYRLQTAGSTAVIFNSSATKRIFRFSKGYPRLINIVCDHALLTGYVKEARTIDAGIVKECEKELKVSPDIRNRPKGKVQRPQTAPGVNQAPEKQTGFGRGLTYLMLVILLVLVAALVMRLSNRTDVLTANLKKIEALITDRNRSDAEVSNPAPQPSPIKIKNSLEPAERPVHSPAGAAGQTPQPQAARSMQGELSEHKQGESAESTDRMEAVGENVHSDVPGTSVEEAGERPVGDGISAKMTRDKPPDRPSRDPLDVARDFIERTGGRLMIHFRYNSNEISGPEFERLSEFAEVAALTPEVMVIVTGHTDTSGSTSYNQKLSQFRANIVKSYFVGKGVSPENIISIGKGPEAPLVKSEAGVRSMSNRRVEIEMRLASQPE